MRLWHESLLPYLDRQRLLSQHRECCALRGLGWGKKHSTVNYVFRHSPALLVAYHLKVMKEMRRRGYNPDRIWENPNYRGKIIGEYNWTTRDEVKEAAELCPIYEEHDDDYLRECMELLKLKSPLLYGFFK